MMKKKWTKISLGLLFLITSLLLLPWAVPLDRYRELITQRVNQEIQGTLHLGKLSLSFWGHLKIQVDGLVLRDSQNRPIISVKEAYFYVPWSTLVSGSPRIVLRMLEPQIQIVKDRSGNFNLLTLISKKSGQKKSSLPQVSSQEGVPSSSDPFKAFPAGLTSWSLSFEFLKARCSYEDQVSGFQSHLESMQMFLKNASLTQPMDLEIWSHVDTRLAQTWTLQGMARAFAKAQIVWKDQTIDQVSTQLELNLNDLEVFMPGVFHKAKGLVAGLKTDLLLSASSIKINSWITQWGPVRVSAQGQVTHLSSAISSEKTKGPQIQLQFQAPEFDLKPWNQWFPALQASDLQGLMSFSGKVQGLIHRPHYQGQLSLQQVSVQSPFLKERPQLEMEIQWTQDQLELRQLRLQAQRNDLVMQGRLMPFAKPHLQLEIRSQGLDFDALRVLSAESQPALQIPSASQTALSQQPQPTQAFEEKIERSLAMLRSHPWAQQATAGIQLKLPSVKARGVIFKKIQCQARWKSLTFFVDPCQAEAFSGLLSFKGQMDFKPKQPTYQWQGQVEALNLGQSIESQLPNLKNTLSGIAFFNFQGQGASLLPSQAMDHFKAQGKIQVKQASITTIDVGKIVAESLTQSLKKITEKIPALQNQKLPTLPSAGFHYEVMEADWNLHQGQWKMPHFYAKAYPHQGLDIQGQLEIHLKDQSLKADWDFIDTYNVTRARDLSIEYEGVHVPALLADGQQPIHFPIHLGCQWFAPCYSSTQVPEALLQVALKNVKKALEQKAQHELKHQAESFLKKVAPAPLQNQLKNQIKGWFR